MQITVKAFGITRDIVGMKEVEISFTGHQVGNLREALYNKYPAIGEMRSVLIAVNREYADDLCLLNEGDEVALIPPVSGG